MTAKKWPPLQTGGRYFYVNNATVKYCFKNNATVQEYSAHLLNTTILMNNKNFFLQNDVLYMTN